MRLAIMEIKMDANMIADMGTISKNLNREIYAIMEKMTRQVEELEKVIKEQSSRQLPSDIKNDDIRESASISLSLEDEFSNSSLDENKDIMECDKMPLVLEGELQNPTLVEKNKLAIDEERLLKEKQVEKQYPKLIMENVLVGVEDFYFPINYLTFGIEEDRQVSFVERPSIATSQVWIYAKNGEMTLLVGDNHLTINFHFLESATFVS